MLCKAYLSITLIQQYLNLDLRKLIVTYQKNKYHNLTQNEFNWMKTFNLIYIRFS